jgi:transposase-like protein
MPKLKKTKALTIVDDLANTKLSIRDIADKHNITAQTVFFINWGRTNKFKAIDYPIRKTTRAYQHELVLMREEEARVKAEKHKERYDAIINDIRFSEKTLSQIAKEYRIHMSEMTRLNTGERHKVEGLTYPLRKTSKIRNKEVVEDFLEGKLTKYEICAKHDVDMNKLYDIVSYQDGGKQLWKKRT